MILDLRRPSMAVDAGILIAVAVLALWASWMGYQGWGLDDVHYLKAAERWAQDGFYLGQTHWELRHGYVIPLAASHYLFGSHEAALIAVSLLFYAGLVAVTYAFCHRAFGRPTALITGLLVATLPLVAAWATTPRPGIAEAFYLTASFLCFATAACLSPRRPAIWLVLAGVLLGLGWLTRETALGLGAAYALLFLLGRPVPRFAFAWLAIGFGLVIAGEMTFYYLETGNPAYRMAIDLNHGVITGGAVSGSPEAAAEVVRTATGVEALGGIANVLGKLAGHFSIDKIAGQAPVTFLHVNTFVDPYISFLTDPYYGLIFWLVVPAALFAMYREGIPERLSGLVKLTLLVGAVSVLFSLYFLFLRPLPRYFLFLACLAALICGAALAEAWRRRQTALVVTVLAGVLISNLVFMEARRGLGLYNERRMVELATRIPETIYTDPATFLSAEFLLRWKHLEGKVVAGAPPPGGLYFFNSERAPVSAHREWVETAQIEQWQAEYAHQAPKRWLAVLLDAAGLTPKLPPSVYERLSQPYGEIKLLRAPTVPIETAPQDLKTKP